MLSLSDSEERSAAKEDAFFPSRATRFAITYRRRLFHPVARFARKTILFEIQREAPHFRFVFSGQGLHRLRISSPRLIAQSSYRSSHPSLLLSLLKFPFTDREKKTTAPGTAVVSR